MVGAFNDSTDVYLAAIVFFFGGVLTIYLCNKLNIKLSNGLSLYVWHSIFSLMYVLYVLNYGGDAIGYYLSSLGELRDFRLGTIAVDWFTSFFSSIIGLSFLGTSLIFNIIGSIGLLVFYSTLRSMLVQADYMKYLFFGIVLLPSMSFWSSGIGKDPISFMAVTLALWSSLNFPERKKVMFFAVFSMLYVRPHMSVILIVALAFSFLATKKISITAKLLMVPFFAVSGVVLAPYLFSYIGMFGDLTISSVQHYVVERQMQNADGGSSIDISSMSLPMVVFSYLFRPLPFEVNNVFVLLSSIENLFMLFLCLFGIKRLFSPNNEKVNHVFICSYLFISLLILSLTTANLGIAVRQKWMVMPMFIYLFMSALLQRKSFMPIMSNDGDGSSVEIKNVNKC